MSWQRPSFCGFFVAIVVLHAWAAQPLQAQILDQRAVNAIPWQNGPCDAQVGSLGTVKVPAGFKFTGREGTLTLLRLTQNTPTPGDLGTICPQDWPNNNAWFLSFIWEDIGFVKDEEKNNIDADALLKSLKEGQAQDNINRQRQGFPPLDLVGWGQAPFYDPQTNLLTWSLRLRMGQGGMAEETINYNSRILGRAGVMSANLVIHPNLLQAELPRYKQILGGFSFVQGQKYSEWRAGDKVAAVGLTALIAGGAVGLAAKSGFLAKFGKVIIVGVVALFGGLVALFRRLFGRSQSA